MSRFSDILSTAKDGNFKTDNFNFKSLKLDDLEKIAELIFKKFDNFDKMTSPMISICQEVQQVHPQFKKILEKKIVLILKSKSVPRLGSVLLEFIKADYIDLLKVFEILNYFTLTNDLKSLIYYYNFISKILRDKSISHYLICLNLIFECRNTNETSVKKEVKKILNEFYESLTTVVDRCSNNVFPMFKWMIYLLTQHKQVEVK